MIAALQDKKLTITVEKSSKILATVNMANKNAFAECTRSLFRNNVVSINRNSNAHDT